VIEKWITAVLGALYDSRVFLAAKRQPIRSSDPAPQQQLHGSRDVGWIPLNTSLTLDRTVRWALGDPIDSRLRPGVKHSEVLGFDDSLSRGVQILEVDVLRATVTSAKLLTGDCEPGAQLDQGKNDAATRFHALDRAQVNLVDATEVGRRMLPAMRPGEIDKSPAGQTREQALTGLIVDRSPADLGDRRVLAQQMAHCPSFRLPIPRLPATTRVPEEGSSFGEADSPAAASAASPCSTMFPSWKSTPWAISRHFGLRR